MAEKKNITKPRAEAGIILFSALVTVFLILSSCQGNKATDCYNVLDGLYDNKLEAQYESTVALSDRNVLYMEVLEFLLKNDTTRAEEKENMSKAKRDQFMYSNDQAQDWTESISEKKKECRELSDKSQNWLIYSLIILLVQLVFAVFFVRQTR
ncbi:hypothetical protein JXA85_08410 [Candidatus Woesearchaeota archaeon]|nr:hypothetical protein [Candidatus Woesearchaeota archaeon]